MFLNTEKPETTLLCIFKICENIQCETVNLINQMLLMPHMQHTRVSKKDTYSCIKAILFFLVLQHRFIG